MSDSKRPAYRPGWTTGRPASDKPAPLEPGERGDQRLAQGLAAERADATFRQAESCPACLAAREAAGEPEGLCDEHLGQALGVTGGWALGTPGRKLR